MASLSGKIYSYSNTVPQKRMVSDRILLADVFDRTTIDALGLDNMNKFRFVNTPHRQYEWLEDSYVPVVDSLTASGGAASSSTTTTITVTTPAIYQPGHVILIDAEKIFVASKSGAVLTVVRNFGGTQATHTDSSVVTVIGTAMIEGADAPDSPSTEAASKYNYSQILERTINVSDSDMLFPNYGMADLWDYQVDHRVAELVQEIDKIPYRGTRNVGTATAARSAGGFGTFITTNITAASSASLTADMLNDALEAAYLAGGMPTKLFTNTVNQRKINGLYEDSITTERSEKVGGHRIQRLMNPIGGPEIELHIDRFCPQSEVWIIDSRYAGYITIDPLHYTELARTGLAEKGMVSGEFGFVVGFEKAHAGITGLATS